MKSHGSVSVGAAKVLRDKRSLRTELLCIGIVQVISPAPAFA